VIRDLDQRRRTLTRRPCRSRTRFLRRHDCRSGACHHRMRSRGHAGV